MFNITDFGPKRDTNRGHCCCVNLYVYCTDARGRGPDDIGGLGEEKPGEIETDDDEFDLYRKRMMLAYKFRPNPLVRKCYNLFYINLFY